MTIDTAIIVLLIPIILSIVSLAFWAGKLSERVKNNQVDIDKQEKVYDKWRAENRQEHQEIMRLIRNGNEK